METKNKTIGSIQKMEECILKEVPFITNSFLGKGLISVVTEQLKSSRLFVLFTFKEGNRITRVRVSVDKHLSYVISVINHDRELVYMSFSKYDSDFRDSLYHQCSNLADLPF